MDMKLMHSEEAKKADYNTAAHFLKNVKMGQIKYKIYEILVG